MEIAEATALLRRYPEYSWLTESGLTMWTVSQVVEHTHVGAGAWQARCKAGDIEGALFFGVQIGWRMPRSGLIRYLASLLVQQSDGNVG